MGYDASNVFALAEGANNTVALATKLSEVASTVISPPMIITGPSLVINSWTQIISSGEEVVAAPTGQALGSQISQETGLAITTDVTTVVSSTSTTVSSTAYSSTASNDAHPMVEGNLEVASGS